MHASPSHYRPKNRLSLLKTDLLNWCRYGAAGPRFAETISIDPRQCELQIDCWTRRHSGRVAGGDWDRTGTPLEDSRKFRHCMLHWRDGQSWQETGAIDYLGGLIAQRQSAVDDCRTPADIAERFEALDRLFATIAQSRQLLTRQQLDPRNFRELGGIYIHIGRHGEPLFGGGGIHRLAIAKILELSLIPAQVGVVHAAAIPTWRQLRQARASAA